VCLSFCIPFPPLKTIWNEITELQFFYLLSQAWHIRWCVNVGMSGGSNLFWRDWTCSMEHEFYVCETDIRYKLWNVVSSQYGLGYILSLIVCSALPVTYRTVCSMSAGKASCFADIPRWHHANSSPTRSVTAKSSHMP